MDKEHVRRKKSTENRIPKHKPSVRVEERAESVGRAQHGRWFERTTAELAVSPKVRRVMLQPEIAAMK